MCNAVITPNTQATQSFSSKLMAALTQMVTSDHSFSAYSVCQSLISECWGQLCCKEIIYRPHISEQFQQNEAVGWKTFQNWPKGYKYFTLNSAENEILSANNQQITDEYSNCCFLDQFSWAWYVSILVSMRMPILAGIFIFSRENLMLSWGWAQKSFIIGASSNTAIQMDH